VRARRTPRELFKLAVESLDCSNVIGVALNDVDLKHSRYASAYSYYQENYQGPESDERLRMQPDAKRKRDSAQPQDRAQPLSRGKNDHSIAL
jgi:hypothetical protein